MTAKEIIEGMSSTPWHADGYTNIFHSDQDGTIANMNSFTPYRENAEAIVSAVNATYGKGINPESIPAMLEILQDISDGNTWNVSDINNILNTAKIK